ncbi:hypothetical protein LV75_004046 [Actinokineospora diospyrosa]|uniref:Uncharacterized protein n=1 Tax=Actinokineospora diospyrosa TaxID=103728 RepID=A0ABT1IFX8_9PSEU|nr:hypothetical protein [Actinokineospora diospyrosa]
MAVLGEVLDEGDLVIDGGNSRYTDDKVNADLLAPLTTLCPQPLPPSTARPTPP